MARTIPISEFKANAAELIRELPEMGGPITITQNGEAKAILQDIDSYEELQETLALIKILALGQQQVEEGRVSPVDEVFERLRNGLEPE